MRSSFPLRATSTALLAVVFAFGVAKASEPAADGAPVILLTGFEPFGPGRPLNPSWQGIKGLEGHSWKGFRLVAREIPVVWGGPLQKLKPLIAELHPVAVFSFGQGGPAGFTIETVAHNRRGPIPDNDGATPTTPETAPGGPVEYQATADADQIVRRLAEKGHPVRVSRQAGRYLCEEALYSLEHLKATGEIQGSVLFSHVPPLNAVVQGKPIDAPRVEAYVMDLLEAWHEGEPNGKPPRTTTAVEKTSYQGQPAPQDPREAAVRAFVERYFRVWSDRDMDGYDDCFMADAAIQHVDDGGRLSTLSRPRFVASQVEAHRRSPVKMIEVPESIEIRFEQQIARAVVYWKLTAGDRVQKGYDHFTLKQDQGRWRIVNLLFYATSER